MIYPECAVWIDDVTLYQNAKHNIKLPVGDLLKVGAWSRPEVGTKAGGRAAAIVREWGITLRQTLLFN